MKHLCLLACLFVLPLLGMAQRYYPTGLESKEKVGLSVGTTAFYGDLRGKGAFEGFKPAIGLSYERFLLPHLSVRSAASLYQLKAADASDPEPSRRQRNLSFHATNAEISLLGVGYLFGHRTPTFQNRKKLNPYLLAGVAVSIFAPKAVYEGKKWDLRSLQTEGVNYNKVTLVVPFGGGIQYKLLPQLDVALQATYHYTFTDYLDDVSTRYQNPANFKDPMAVILADRRPELGLDRNEPGAVRGNPAVNDSYAIFSLQLHYHLLRYQYRGKEIRKLYQ